MASNLLPQQVRVRLDARIDELFGRVLTGFPCPLGYHSRLELGWCNLSEHEAKQVRDVLHLGVLTPTTSMRVYVDTVAVSPSKNRAICVRLFGRDAPDADPVLQGMVNKEMVTSRGFISYRLGANIAAEFFKWLDEAVSLSHDINNGLETYRDIMRMTKTAGHLRRMMPELYRLATGLNQDPSFRASAVPHEWSKYPRRPVEWLADTLAKCSLLPENNEARWSKRDQHTWPVIGET